MSPHASSSRALILSRPVVIALLASGFALIFTTALLTGFSTRGIAAANQRTAQTQHALTASTQFLSALAEAAALAPSGGPDESRARRFRTQRERIRVELATLTSHFATQPALQPVVAQLQQLTEGYLNGLENPTSAAAVDPAGANTLATAAPREAPRVMDEVQQLVATLQRNQFLALAQRSAAAANRADMVQTLNLALILLGGALAVAVSIWLLRRVRELEGLITVCAWTRRVQWEGKWLSFEEYLAKRFNLFCTHGICEEAAEKMREEAANTPIPADFSR